MDDADAAPVFWKGNERLAPAGFSVLREVDIRRSIAVPLTDDQLATFHLKRLLNGAGGTRIDMD